MKTIMCKCGIFLGIKTHYCDIFNHHMVCHKGVFMCIDCFRERENMPNIKITAEVNGKQVPLKTVSIETFEAIKALEKPKEIPVARIAIIDNIKYRRLIFKVTKQIAERKDQYVSIDLESGLVCGHWSGDDDGNCGSQYGYNYKNVQPL